MERNKIKSISLWVGSTSLSLSARKICPTYFFFIQNWVKEQSPGRHWCLAKYMSSSQWKHLEWPFDTQCVSFRAKTLRVALVHMALYSRLSTWCVNVAFSIVLNFLLSLREKIFLGFPHLSSFILFPKHSSLLIEPNVLSMYLVRS